jgi:hypothetical protein
MAARIQDLLSKKNANTRLKKVSVRRDRKPLQASITERLICDNCSRLPLRNTLYPNASSIASESRVASNCSGCVI